MSELFGRFGRFLREVKRRTGYRPAVVLCVTAVGAVLLGLLPAVSGTGGLGAPVCAKPAMTDPVPSLRSLSATPQTVEIHFDEVVPAGEIPPPEQEYAAELDTTGRAALRLQRACRFVRGTMADDADFEVCLPVEGWNGKLVFWAPGRIGTEFEGGVVIRPVALSQGYAYATTDFGLSLETLSEPENQFADGRQWAAETTRFAKRLVKHHYGREPRRVYTTGHSYGAYLTTRLLEEHPDLYDGGIRHAGGNWIYSGLRAYAIWLRHWDERPVNSLMYDVAARLPNGFEYRLGQERGTEDRWEAAVRGWRNILSAFLPAVDPGYDPDGNGELSRTEVESWDADERPDRVAARLAPTAVTGCLERKMIAFSGLADVYSPPSAEREYRRLVEETVGEDRVTLYLKADADHNHGFPVSLNERGEPVGFWPEALRALDAWVEEGNPPGTIAELSPR